jgi:hypothetical protein
MQKRSISLPTPSKMLLRALDSETCCIVAIDSEGFWVLPSSMHCPRPTILTLTPVEFTNLLEQKAGRSVEEILKSGTADASLQRIACQIFNEKNPWQGLGGSV